MPEPVNTAPEGLDAADAGHWTGALFRRLTGKAADAPPRDIAEAQAPHVPRNFVIIVCAQALSKSGDVLADPKIILPWLIGALGAPTFLIGFLVPIRESLALLPQVPVSGLIGRFAVRKGFWCAAAAIQGLAIAAMGVLALAGLEGSAAGWTVVGLLVVFSLARGIGSVTSKDTLGRTVSKGLRGRVSGQAATLSGVVATLVGLALVLLPPAARPDWLLYTLLIAAGGAWGLAATVFAAVHECSATVDRSTGLAAVLRRQAGLLKRDPELRRFILARTLMIATAFAGPVYVGLARKADGSSLAALGGLLLAAGIANLSSSWLWGAFADMSSRATMAAGAALCGALGLVVLLALAVVPALAQSTLFFAAAILVLYVGHAGVRIGRKTQVVDLAGPDAKGDYVALSNTIIGVSLLAMGALVGGLIAIGLKWALLALSCAALAGSLLAMRMRNVQRDAAGQVDGRG